MKGIGVTQLSKVVQNSIKLIKNYSPTLTLQQQSKHTGLFSSLKALQPQHLSLQSKTRKGVGMRNLMQYGGLRLTIYRLAKGQTMKLHDHPQMAVINYILQGSLLAKLYTPEGNGMYTKSQQKLMPGDIKYIDGMRDLKENMHQFIAIETSYFLDIIFPDYDEKRNCLFYQQQKQIEKDKFQLKQVYCEHDFYMF